MNDNELLAEKHRTQKVLDDISEHDLIKYVADTHSRIEALEISLRLKLKYGVPRVMVDSEEQTASRP